MKVTDAIYVAGHTGLVGSALVRALKQRGYQTIITRTSRELDLRNQAAVDDFFRTVRPEYVFMAAARVGGIMANSTFPADFLYDNLMISAHVIEAAYRYDCTKLLYLGSSCIYPRLSVQPIHETALLSGPLEATNEWYAIAKIAGLKLCQAYARQHNKRFIAAMPTNIYGIGDRFDVRSSHVIPALIMRCIAAEQQGQEELVVWGTGRARREFLYVDDLAEALLLLMERYEDEQWINVGAGVDYSIAELSSLIAGLVGFSGKLVFDATMPEGTFQKLLDSSLIKQLGWSARTPLEVGLMKTIHWYHDRQSQEKGKHELAETMDS